MAFDLIGVEVGVLLAPENEEFDYYSVNNPKLPFGFYDESQYVVGKERFEQARSSVLNYVKDSVEGTYGILSVQWPARDEEAYNDLISGDCPVDFDYSFFKDKQEILYSVCKNDGEIIEGFLEAALDELEKTTIVEDKSPNAWTEYTLSKEECDRQVEVMVAKIEGEGIHNGSGYHGLKAFELYGNKYNVYCEAIKDSDQGKEAYSLYYALEYDGGDNLWEDWARTNAIDMAELKTLIYEIASKDYSVDAQLNFPLEDLELEVSTLKVLKNADFKTLANIVNVGREGLKLIPDLDGIMFDDIVSSCLNLGLELPSEYDKTEAVIKSIDKDKIIPGSKVVIDIAEKKLGETVWVNPDITEDEKIESTDTCVCVDVVYDYNPIDAVEVFKELDYWVESRYNAITLAEAISKEYNIPVKNLLPGDVPFDKVVADAMDRADKGSDKDTVKSDVDLDK